MVQNKWGKIHDGGKYGIFKMIPAMLRSYIKLDGKGAVSTMLKVKGNLFDDTVGPFHEQFFGIIVFSNLLKEVFALHAVNLKGF